MSTPPLRRRFWETVPMAEMTVPEWEALCDGCGKCCMIKMQEDDDPDLLADGDRLPEWHPLVTGDRLSVHTTGNSMQDRTIPEYDVDEDEWYDYVIEGGH